jgi:Rad3-related DNA helicase
VEYEDILSENATLSAKIKEYKSALDEVILTCTDSESFSQTEKGEVRVGYCNSTELPSKLITTAGNLYEAIGKLMREDAALYDFLTDLYADVSDIVFAAGFFDEKFRFFASRENNELLARILCIDPSGIIENVISSARAVIMFSATLSPIEYYKEVVGCDTAETLEVASPFEKDNLCLIAYDALSTRLTDRRDTADECAEIITEAIETHPGKYMVYFPSYDYMKRVCRAFARIAPEDCGIIMQRRGMSYGERERFIDMFRDSTRKFIIGFCVLGGMFSEGIDLAGESLIGAFIVGTGMPQLSAERNIMAMYYDEKNERGHEFAYTCPGMNKVLQAAGRVIRTENDRGVVILLDDRYGDINMKMMFPPHWRHVKYTGDVESMKSILSEFWEKNN